MGKYMSKYMTPDEYVRSSLIEYPSLYSSETWDACRMKVFDHLFNTLGNGVETTRDLRKHLLRDPKINLDEADHYIGEQLYYGYTNVKAYTDDRLQKNPSIRKIVKKDEQHLYPEVKYWLGFSFHTERDWKPYPSFNKRYDLVWSCNHFKNLKGEWVEAAIWFYDRCLKYFNDNPNNYHYSYPSDNQREDVKLIEYFVEARQNRYKTDEDFAKAYEVPFDGDFEKFARLRWDMEKERIINYIKETLVMLHGMRRR